METDAGAGLTGDEMTMIGIYVYVQFSTMPKIICRILRIEKWGFHVYYSHFRLGYNDAKLTRFVFNNGILFWKFLSPQRCIIFKAPLLHFSSKGLKVDLVT